MIHTEFKKSHWGVWAKGQSDWAHEAKSHHSFYTMLRPRNVIISSICQILGNKSDYFNNNISKFIQSSLDLLGQKSGLQAVTGCRIGATVTGLKCEWMKGHNLIMKHVFVNLNIKTMTTNHFICTAIWRKIWSLYPTFSVFKGQYVHFCHY